VKWPIMQRNEVKFARVVARVKNHDLPKRTRAGSPIGRTRATRICTGSRSREPSPAVLRAMGARGMRHGPPGLCRAGCGLCVAFSTGRQAAPVLETWHCGLVAMFPRPRRLHGSPYCTPLFLPFSDFEKEYHKAMNQAFMRVAGRVLWVALLSCCARQRVTKRRLDTRECQERASGVTEGGRIVGKGAISSVINFFKGSRANARRDGSTDGERAGRKRFLTPLRARVPGAAV